MWKLVLEVLSYFIFSCVTYLICFLDRNSNEYLQATHLRQLFLNTNNSTYMYSNITTISQYWQWLEESFVMNIAAGDWYNGQPDNYSQGYISDRTNRLIGWATIRQLRVKPDTCRVSPSIRDWIPNCYGEYSRSNEESRSFLPGWTTSITSLNYSSSINEAFIHQTSQQLDTSIYMGQFATYSSGGYVYELRDSPSKIRADLSQLNQLGWIDKKTRAVIIQMNLYNPNIPIFTSVGIIIELLPSSGVFPSAGFEPLYTSGFQSVFQIICVFIYLLFTIYLMILEIRSFIRLKKLYFLQVWSYIEVTIIACSWAGVGTYILRTNEAARITRSFRETYGDAYLNLQFLSYINDVFSCLRGVCCFFVTLRFLHLCRYNQRLSLLSNTLKYSRRELMSYAFMFLIIFMAYLALFYLQFASYVWECSSLLQTAQMICQMIKLKFDTTTIVDAAPILGPLYFASFIVFVVFVCINMFVSIINDNFRRVRADVYKIHSDQMDAFVKFFSKIRRWFGNKKVNVAKINEKQNVITVAEMPDPLKKLSNRLDQLLVCINRHYETDKARTTWTETTINI